MRVVNLLHACSKFLCVCTTDWGVEFRTPNEAMNFVPPSKICLALWCQTYLGTQVELGQTIIDKVVGYLIGNKTVIGTLGSTRPLARPMGPPKVVPGGF